MAKETATETRGKEDGRRWPWVTAFESTPAWALVILIFLTADLIVTAWSAYETRQLRRENVEREIRREHERWQTAPTEPSPPSPLTPR